MGGGVAGGSGEGGLRGGDGCGEGLEVKMDRRCFECRDEIASACRFPWLAGFVGAHLVAGSYFGLLLPNIKLFHA